VALPRLRVADIFERALVDERRALGVHEDENAVGRGEAGVNVAARRLANLDKQVGAGRRIDTERAGL